MALRLTQSRAKDYEYVTYQNDKETWSNIEYIKIDVDKDEYKQLVCSTGGYVANVTRRYIEDNNIKGLVRYIILANIPLDYADIVSAYIYLGKDNEELSILYERDYYAVKYMREKFRECVVETGNIWELPSEYSIFEIASKSSKATLGIELEDGYEVEIGDKLIYDGLGILSEGTRKKMERAGGNEIGIEILPKNYHMRARLTILNKDLEPLQRWQVATGISDKVGYYNKANMIGADTDKLDTEEYTIEVSVSYIRSLNKSRLRQNKARAIKTKQGQ